jgi:hypothetical protein
MCVQKHKFVTVQVTHLHDCYLHLHYLSTSTLFFCSVMYQNVIREHNENFKRQDK